MEDKPNYPLNSLYYFAVMLDMQRTMIDAYYGGLEKMLTGQPKPHDFVQRQEGNVAYLDIDKLQKRRYRP